MKDGERDDDWGIEEQDNDRVPEDYAEPVTLLEDNYNGYTL